MTKPRLLDLFCGAGGAGMGYHQAGFEVVGVDIAPMSHYPFPFIQADALEVLERGHYWKASDGKWYGPNDFDAIHASPPCQHYSAATRDPAKHPDLYSPTRDALIRTRKPYIIENVIGAPYHHGVVLCGSMFGLTENGEWIERHRNFETSWLVFQPLCSHPAERRAMLVTGHAFIKEPRDCGRHSRQGPFDLAQRLMGIDWMTRKELVLAIPPAYTRWIGEQLLAHLKASR